MLLRDLTHRRVVMLLRGLTYLRVATLLRRGLALGRDESLHRSALRAGPHRLPFRP